MKKLIQTVIKKLYPELDSGLHLPKFAQVVRAAKPPSSGDISSDIEPYYAVDIQLLTEKGEIDTSKPIYEAVPLPVLAGSDQQGIYGFPSKGTWLIIEFAYASPEHPVIVGILPHRRTLPSVPIGELLWQLNPAVFIRADKGKWRMQADKLWIGNSSINLLEEVRQLAQILETHTHSGVEKGGSVTQPPLQAASIAGVKDNVSEIKG